MIQFNVRNRIAFIASYPPKMCQRAAFIPYLAEQMLLASNGSFEPVIIALDSEFLENYGEWIECVIRKDLKSDYMEAADFINTGNLDMLIVQYEGHCLGGDSGGHIDSLLRHVQVPTMTILRTIPQNPSVACFQELVDICDASWKVIVTHKRGVDLLRNLYGISGHKIEVIPYDITESHGREMFRSDVGWHYWRLASEQLPQKIKNRQLEFSKSDGASDFL